MPFIAEELHQNLVRSFDHTAPLSVHLADWPTYDQDLIDEKLNRAMNAVMRLASLGHAARNKANIKVRQPLSEAAFAVGNAEEQFVVEEYSDILEDEINVKSVRLLGGANEAVSYKINPLPMQLGQKHKKLYPVIRQAILALPADEAAKTLLEGNSIFVKVDGKTIEVLPGEVEVHADAKEGFEVASEGAYLAALVTDLTQDLIDEGLVREFVRRVQSLRKDAGLEISDRILLYFTASEQLTAAALKFADYIKLETLATEMINKAAPQDLPTANDQFDNETLTISLKKA